MIPGSAAFVDNGRWADKSFGPTSIAATKNMMVMAAFQTVKEALLFPVAFISSSFSFIGVCAGDELGLFNNILGTFEKAQSNEGRRLSRTSWTGRCENTSAASKFRTY